MHFHYIELSGSALQSNSEGGELDICRVSEGLSDDEALPPVRIWTVSTEGAKRITATRR